MVCPHVRMAHEPTLSGEKAEGLLWTAHAHFRAQTATPPSLRAAPFPSVWSHLCLRCGFSSGNRPRPVLELYAYGLSFKLVGISLFYFYISVFKNNVNTQNIKIGKNNHPIFSQHHYFFCIFPYMCPPQVVILGRA